MNWGENDNLNVPIALFKEETQSQGTGYSIGIEFSQLKVVRERCITKLNKTAEASTLSELKLVDNRTSGLSLRLLEVLLSFNQAQVSLEKHSIVCQLTSSRRTCYCEMLLLFTWLLIRLIAVYHSHKNQLQSYQRGRRRHHSKLFGIKFVGFCRT